MLRRKDITPHTDAESETRNLFGQVTGPRRGVDNLVIKDGEVEREAEPDGVCGLHFGLSDVEGLLVGFLRVLDDGCGQADALLSVATRASQHLAAD